jgi:hypothetical protein
MLLAVSNGAAKWYPIYDEQEAAEFIRKNDPGNDDGEYQYGWYFITSDGEFLGFIDLQGDDDMAGILTGNLLTAKSWMQKNSQKTF